MMIEDTEIETDWSRKKRGRVQGRFLKGPIPFTHLTAATRLPGHALTVLLAIYHQTALTRKEWVTLPKGLVSELGLSRDVKSRALSSLHAAGIVDVENAKGRTSRVRLKDPLTSTTFLSDSPGNINCG
jgi:DNA-binding transcriptional ArsR family regulator